MKYIKIRDWFYRLFKRNSIEVCNTTNCDTATVTSVELIGEAVYEVKYEVLADSLEKITGHKSHGDKCGCIEIQIEIP